MKNTLNNGLKVAISREAIINAIKEMNNKERESLMEDLLALTSPKYLECIREARADYNAGRVKPHSAIFGKKTKFGTYRFRIGDYRIISLISKGAI
ncbi:MAG: hypothetical protein AB1599_05260 [Planctomycetota bacterium]